jgi:hypothetical protein
MLFDWKIIATVFALFAVVLGFLGTSPVVSSFFNSVFGTFSSNVDLDFFKETRDVPFSLNITDYPEMILSIKESGNISLEPDEFTATVNNAKISNAKTVKIYNFKGTASVKNRTLTLDGTFQNLEIDAGTTLSGSKIQASGTFKKVTLENAGIKTLDVTTTGTLVLNGTEIRFVNKNVNIKSPMGAFYFSNYMYVNGYASSISMPAEKIKTE